KTTLTKIPLYQEGCPSAWGVCSACEYDDAFAVTLDQPTATSVSPVEALAFAEGFGEGGEELHAVFDVLQVHDLAGRVHVAERDRDEAAGHATASHLDGTGIGARRARVGFDLIGNLQLLR